MRSGLKETIRRIHARSPGTGTGTGTAAAGQTADPAEPASRILRARRLVARLRADSLTRNSFGVMATTAVNGAFGYVYWIAAARLLPTSTVGLGSTLVSAMVIISLGVYLGPGGQLIARLPTRTTRAQWLLSVYSTQLLCMFATLLAAAAALVPLAVLLRPLRLLESDPAVAAWFVLGAVGWTSCGLLDDVFVGQRRADFMFWRNAFSSGLKLAALIAIALLSKPGASTIIGTWAVSGLAGAVFGLLLCHRAFYRLGRIPRPSGGLLPELRAEMSALARPSIGHHAISVAGLLPTYLLPIVVTARLGPQQNAYFYVTWMIASAIFTISPAVSVAIFAEGSHDSSHLRTLARSSLRIVLAMLLPAVLIVGAAGQPILHLYGAAYAAAGFGLLLILLSSSFPDAVTNVATATLRVRNLLPRAAALNIAMAVIAVVGAWELTPRFGIVGAGVAWLLAQSVGTLAVLAHPRTFWPAKDAG
ncbi:lipopolysaccharide biosynthesis protein [Actinospica robiniae]|uniref:lipopolysaccharide biosynthesis protein n=1 Tax=Actinospica robiniae TaxID=304901 RepID=UPI00040135B9|nr:hypothetical protein [Actinospica robiniae]